MNSLKYLKLLVFLACASMVLACGPERRGGGGGGGGSGGPGNGDNGDDDDDGDDGDDDGDPVQDPNARPDTDVYVDDEASDRVGTSTVDQETITSQEDRASIVISPGALDQGYDIKILSRPLGDFVETSNIIDGVYEFRCENCEDGPFTLAIAGTVKIYLPLNGHLVVDSSQVELVAWENRWVPLAEESPLTILPGLPQAGARVRYLGIYAIRVKGGFGSLLDDVVVDDPEIEDPPGEVLGCPAPRDEIARGFEVGKVFPDPRLRDADNTGSRLYDYCRPDLKAVLLVSSAAW